MSGFIGQRFGFMPIAAPITEPAVGYGAAAGVAFMSQPVAKERPNITFVGGLGTENGTKGVMAGDLRHWFDRRLQTLAATIYADVNLDFYGIGPDSPLADHPQRYHLKPAAALFEAKYRPWNAPVYVGAAYVFAQTDVRFDAPQGTPGLPSFTNTSTVSAISPTLTFDSRNNLFTPTRGTYVESRMTFAMKAIGSDDNFQRFGIVAMQYTPLPSQVFLGLRGEISTSSENTPFYLRPFIYQRGVPAMRYQGENMSQAEIELRWQFWTRLSVVGFGGGGVTWTAIDGRERTKSVGAGGLGFRYEIARAYGIHMGADFAYGPNGSAFYVQFGSAWARP
jgi:hypothetical protein